MRRTWDKSRLGLATFRCFQKVSSYLCFGLPMRSTLFSLALSSTRQTIKEDKALIYYDWKNCILPLLDSAPLKLNPEFFGIEQYFAAKSLIASRSFEIDDYYGFGMVPLADLFNHKTGAEDVHFTTELSQDKSYEEPGEDNKISMYDNGGEYEILSPHSYSMTSSSNGGELESASTSEHDPNVLEMIIVKYVKAGSEVFNTYGYVGNAALLHRYGFTEADNPYDIVNIDMELIVQWSSALFSSRHSRMRLSLWRKLDYSGYISQNSEYFEISFDGEPQVELLVLLYIILLPEEAYHDLKLEASAVGDHNKCTSIASLKKYDIPFRKGSELCKNLLLTESVCNALLSIADNRERCYGFNSLDDDTRAMNQCCPIQDRKVYHSLMLRVSERRILEKLRAYSSKCIGFSKTKESSRRKEIKRK